MLTKVFIFAVSTYVASAHLCMLSPPQRTALADINKAGSDSCMLVKGPCGMTKPGMSKVHLEAGKNFTVVFQKNLDHFNSASPGYWSVSIGEESGKLMELFRMADTATPSLTVYSANVTIPKQMGKNMVIQTQYVTMNPKAPAVFYQCADVAIMKMEEQ